MAYRFIRQRGFVEIELSGVIDGLERLTKEEWDLTVASGAILYNYEQVESVQFDPWAVSDSTKRLASLGMRFAAYAPQPEWFGVNRQLAQLSNVDPGQVRIFRERVSAVAWLLHSDARD